MNLRLIIILVEFKLVLTLFENDALQKSQKQLSLLAIPLILIPYFLKLIPATSLE